MSPKSISLILISIGAIGIMFGLISPYLIQACCVYMLHAYQKNISMLFFISVLILVAGVYLFTRREGEVRTIERILTPDEKEIVSALQKRKDRKATQAELRKELGFSKAKLSVLLSKMQERNLIQKIKVGRTNLVFLKEI
jgi:uncharacterized membrane protein